MRTSAPSAVGLGVSRAVSLARLVAVSLLVTMLASCGGDGGAQTDGRRVYRHALDNKVDSVDPARAATVYANHLIVNVFDTLYRYRYLTRPYELAPNLALRMPEVSADGLAYTIEIRRGVHFIDDAAFVDANGRGREVTAADVVYSIERQLDPATHSQGDWLWRGKVERLEVIDRYTLRIHLSQRFPQLVHTLAQGFAAVMAREAVAYYGDQIGVHPVGSGPFILQSLDAQRAVLIANPDYRREPVDLEAEGYDDARHAGYGLDAIDGRSPPFIDQLEIWFIAEDPARWGSFTKGTEVQYARVSNDSLPADALDRIREGRYEGYHALAVAAPEVIYHTFNFAFDEIGYHADPAREERNHLLRCALVRTYDWAARNANYHKGTAAVFPGVLPPAVPEFDAQLDAASATRSLDAARDYLRRGAWDEESLPQLVYGFNGTTLQHQYFEQFRAWTAQVGYPLSKVNPKPFPNFAAFAKAIRNGELMMSYKSWSLDYPDAENVLQLYYGPNGSPGSNDANYANPHYDALYELASTMAPSAERTAIFREMNEILIDDCAVITGMARQQLLMWHDDVVYYPDRNIVGGYSLKYVSLGAPRTDAEDE